MIDLNVLSLLQYKEINEKTEKIQKEINKTYLTKKKAKLLDMQSKNIPIDK